MRVPGSRLPAGRTRRIVVVAVACAVIAATGVGVGYAGTEEPAPGLLTAEDLGKNWVNSSAHQSDFYVTDLGVTCNGEQLWVDTSLAERLIPANVAAHEWTGPPRPGDPYDQFGTFQYPLTAAAAELARQEMADFADCVRTGGLSPQRYRFFIEPGPRPRWIVSVFSSGTFPSSAVAAIVADRNIVLLNTSLGAGPDFFDWIQKLTVDALKKCLAHCD